MGIPFPPRKITKDRPLKGTREVAIGLSPSEHLVGRAVGPIPEVRRETSVPCCPQPSGKARLDSPLF